jgi:hypothetical protein
MKHATMTVWPEPVDHAARLRRLLLARAERVVGGDLVGAAPLVFVVDGETLEAHLDTQGYLILRIRTDGTTAGPRRRLAAADLTDVSLDRLIAQRLRNVPAPRPALAPTPVPVPVVNDRDSVITRLQALIGLAPVKRLIAGLADLHDFDQHRARRGLPAVAPSPHLVFTGNPGTGKTTVARLVGELYRAVGVLPRGHVVEATRADMVAAYLGQTALKTRALCERALGGVLFIDEAYTLSQGHFNEYGEEAIAELLTFMENHRGRFAVIVAGYPDEMRQFLESNPGLRSRFDEVVAFPDYSDGELLDIFELLVAENQFTITPATRVAVGQVIATLPRDRSFANARSVRQLFNRVVARHAHGLAQHTIRTDVMNVINEWAVPQRATQVAPPGGPDGETPPPDHHPGYL